MKDEKLEKDYRHVLENIDEFRTFLTDILSGIVWQYADGECTNILFTNSSEYSSQKSQKYENEDFRSWLDDVIFCSMRQYTRKLDAEEYHFYYREKMNHFFK